VQFLTLATLGDLSAAYQLHGVCNACHGMRPLPMVRLLHELGAGFPIGQVRNRLSCRERGGRDCGIRIVWVGC
jgi:hypothetical protein